MNDREHATPQPARLASEAALRAAARMAECCEERRRAALSDARRQFRIVWALLAGGVILLLALPRLVAFIDYTAATLPPDAVREARTALAAIVDNEAEMIEELEAAEADLSSARSHLETLRAELESARAAFAAAQADPLATWIAMPFAGPDEGDATLDVRIHAFARASDGALIAAGWADRPRQVARLLRSADGRSWSEVAPPLASRDAEGERFHALAAIPGLGLMAGGHEVAAEALRPVLAQSDDGVAWRRVALPALSGAIRAIAPAPGGGVLAAGERDGRAWALLSRDGATWSEVLGPDATTRFEGSIEALSPAPALGGGVLAAGSFEAGVDGEPAVLLRSRDGEIWTRIATSDLDDDAMRSLHGLATSPTSGLLAIGLTDADGDRAGPHRMLRADDPRRWRVVATPSPAASPVATPGPRPPRGLVTLARPEPARGGAPPSSGPARALLGKPELRVAATAPDGALVAGGMIRTRPGPDSGWPLIVSETAEGDWRAIALSPPEDGRRPQPEGPPSRRPPSIADFRFGAIGAIGAAADGALVMAIHGSGPGSDRILRQANAQERSAIAEALLDVESAENLGRHVLVDRNAAAMTDRLQFLARDLEIVDGQVAQRLRIAQAARSTRERQATARENMAAAAANLEDALRRGEPVRQASWIATRLAVVALIIFLVQIVVNRYRYFQKLADFHDSRAQAFRLLADSGPEAAGALLRDMTLTELTAGLSTDGIGFGKASEAPTGHLAATLAAALRRA